MDEMIMYMFCSLLFCEQHQLYNLSTVSGYHPQVPPIANNKNTLTMSRKASTSGRFDFGSMDPELKLAIRTIIQSPPSSSKELREWCRITPKLSDNSSIKQISDKCSSIYREFIEQVGHATHNQKAAKQAKQLYKALCVYFLHMLSVSFEYEPLGRHFNHFTAFSDTEHMKYVSDFLHCHLMAIIDSASTMPETVKYYINQALSDTWEFFKE